MSMETLLLVLENRLRQTEEALVAERRASRRTAESCSAGGENMSSWCRRGRNWETRDVQRRKRLEQSSQQQCLVSVESHCSKLLCRVQPDGDPGCCSGWKTWKFRSSPTNTTMTRAERLSIQLYCMLALTCRKKTLQVVQQVPRGHGFEAWRQLCRKFGQHPPVRSRGMLQAPLVVDEISRVEAVGPSVEEQRKVREEKSGDVVSDRQSARPTTRDRARQETAEFLRTRQVFAVSGDMMNPTDLVSLGSREGHESAKPKENFSWRKAGHSKSEYKYFSAVREKRLVQRDKADRHTAGDPEMGKTEFSGRKRDKRAEHHPRARCLPFSRR